MGTSGVDPVKVKSPSESEKSTSFGAADFLDPQNSALILGPWTEVPAICLHCDFPYKSTEKKKMPILSVHLSV